MAKKAGASAEQKPAAAVKTPAEATFDKGQLAHCSRYAGRTDVINALLEEGKTYSFSEVDKIISDFDGTDFSEFREKRGK